MDRFNKRKGKKRTIVKRKFTDKEDKLLLKLVEQFGLKDWKKISNKMKDRTPRQCRERWKYYLSGETNNGNWTKHEDEMLLEKYELYGPHWAKISVFFEDKNDVNLKNRFHRLQRNRYKSNKIDHQEKLNNLSSNDTMTQQTPQSSASEDDQNKVRCGRRFIDFPLPISLFAF